MTEIEDTPDRVTRAFDEYVESFRTGRGNPGPFLDRFEGGERKELDLLIEAFIATAPVSEPDPSDPRIAAIADQVVDELESTATGLAPMLARLRQKARLTQQAVVEAIAESIKASPSETEKIDVYYHRLEWGSLPPDGLSDRLFGLLAGILGVETGQLKEAANDSGVLLDVSGEIFARAAEETDLGSDGAVAFRKTGMDGPPPEEDSDSRPDRIDELFTGG